MSETITERKMEIKTPVPGEAISEVELASIIKEDGEFVNIDEPILEFDSDKATLELTAPATGKIAYAFPINEGETYATDIVIGYVIVGENASSGKEISEQPAPKPVDQTPRPEVKVRPEKKEVLPEQDKLAGNLDSIPNTPGENPPARERVRKFKQVAINRFRLSKKNQAMLTTVNEVDMTNIMSIRKEYGSLFLEKYGCKLGFMSFFTKACTIALQEFPALNSTLDEEKMEYVRFKDVNVGIAVSTEKGLMVPNVYHTEKKSLSEIEQDIAALATRGREGAIKPQDLGGGTFTITNGGVFGSVLSTPMLNYPQSGILGMHGIHKRPIALGDDVVVRPMMYIALSYDHCVADGKDSVSFLVRVKQLLENPMDLISGKSSEKELLDL